MLKRPSVSETTGKRNRSVSAFGFVPKKGKARLFAKRPAFNKKRSWANIPYVRHDTKYVKSRADRSIWKRCMEWSGMEWDGVELDGMERNVIALTGVRWNVWNGNQSTSLARDFMG